MRRVLRRAVAAVVVVAAPALAQPAVQLPVLPALGRRPASPVARAAHAAQRRYEQVRRRLLAPASRGSVPCEVTIGRLCYWDDNGLPRPPLEPPAARRARRALIADLDRAAAADSADDWIAGQRVRYLVEAARVEADSAAAARSVVERWTAPPTRATPADPAAPPRGWLAADSAAAACRGTPWWCRALAGLAAHAAGRHAAAAAAFADARALLPNSAARCAWDDLSPWLPDRVVGAYRRLPCGSAERVRYERRAWRLAQPFWTLGGDDLRNELAARRVLARLQSAGENPQGMSWGEDLAASDVRYGVPTRWSVRPAIGLDAEPGVVGHEPAPSYDFWPDARALAPDALTGVTPRLPGAGAWALRRERAQSRYAPDYAAAGVYALPARLARFRRGDTLVVVGSYDARDRGDSVPPGTGTGPVRAGFVLDALWDDSAATMVREGAARQGALVLKVRPARVPDGAAARPDSAPAPAWLASLEVLDSAAVRYDAQGEVRRGRAGRLRDTVAPLARTARLSDLLLVRPGLAAIAAPSLDLAVDSAAGAAAARVGEPVGLFWEQYTVPGTAPGGAAADTVVITATRLEPSLRERLGALVGRPVVLRAVRARYAVAPGGGAVTGRAVTLTWPDVPPGPYRLEISAPARPGLPAAASALVVQVSR